MEASGCGLSVREYWIILRLSGVNNVVKEKSDVIYIATRDKPAYTNRCNEIYYNNFVLKKSDGKVGYWPKQQQI